MRVNIRQNLDSCLFFLTACSCPSRWQSLGMLDLSNDLYISEFEIKEIYREREINVYSMHLPANEIPTKTKRYTEYKSALALVLI